MTEKHCKACDNRYIDTSKGCSWCVVCANCMEQKPNMIRCCKYLRCETCIEIHNADWKKYNVQHNREDKEEKVTSVNHQGFTFGQRVAVSEIKVPLFLLLTDKQKANLEQKEYTLYSLYSLPSASNNFKWFVMATMINEVTVNNFDTYSYTGKPKFGNIREFSVANLGQFATAIKQPEKCVPYYYRWSIYFPDYKCDPAVAIKNNPSNVEFFDEKKYLLQAVKIDGTAVRNIKENLLDNEICSEAIKQTPIAYAYISPSMRTDTLYNNSQKDIIRQMFFSSFSLREN